MSFAGIQSSVSLSASQASALGLIRQRIKEGEPCVIFVTGKAGTGKSTVIHAIKRAFRVVTVAPTGLAALNVGGETLHRFFAIPIGLTDPFKAKPLREGRRKLLMAIDALVIDEISMARADVIDAVSAVMSATLQDPRPFGGKPVIVVGDMWQLEPVAPRSGEESSWFYDLYESTFWFDARVFKGTPSSLGLDTVQIEICELTEMFRQSDENFKDALNLIRIGDPEGLRHINSRAGATWKGTQPICLTLTNAKADSINEQCLSRLTDEAEVFTAVVSGDFRESEYPLPLELTLKQGSRVMVARNLMIDGALVSNGSLGKILSIDGDEVRVALDDGRECAIKPVEWEKTTFGVTDSGELTNTATGKFKQIPLRLAYAVTGHKAQGQTLDSAYLALERPTFAHGQLYVSLSRVRTIEGLFLDRKLTARDIVVNPRVVEFAGGFL